MFESWRGIKRVRQLCRSSLRKITQLYWVDVGSTPTFGSNMEKANATNYLEKLLTQIEPYILTDDDRKMYSRDPVDYLFRKIDRKKFRRKQLGDESRKNLRAKIKLSVDSNRPIHFVIPFGGYKHFWDSSYPEPDWAELFNFRYITEFVLPILSAYKPGVIVEYMSEDLILPRMNNYPKESIEQYMATFGKLIAWYQKQLPSNLQFSVFRVGDRCDTQKLITEVEGLLPERRMIFDSLSIENQERELKRSYRSIFWTGEKDLTKLSEKAKKDIIVESRLIELAYYDTEAKPEYIGNYLGEDNHICICFSFGLSPDNAFDDLTLGSTFGSIVDFWIGRGVLINDDSSFYPKITSAKQYADMIGQLSSEKTTLGLPGKNFSSIDICNKTLLINGSSE